MEHERKDEGLYSDEEMYVGIDMRENQSD